MTLLLNLCLGIVLIITLNALLVRVVRVAPLLAAALVAVLSVLVYLPLAAVFWPGGDVVTIQLTAFLLTCLICGMFWQARECGDTASARGFLGPRVIVGFFIGLATVDAAFIVVAERGLSPNLASALLPEPRSGAMVRSAFPGVVADDYQKKESLYNEFLAQRERQLARGWQINKGWLNGTPRVGEVAVFQVQASTREGKPVAGGQIAGSFLRAANSDLDTAFVMEEVAPGLYQAELQLPAAGRWQLVMNLQRDTEQHEIRASTSVTE